MGYGSKMQKIAKIELWTSSDLQSQGRPHIRRDQEWLKTGMLQSGGETNKHSREIGIEKPFLKSVEEKNLKMKDKPLHKDNNPIGDESKQEIAEPTINIGDNKFRSAMPKVTTLTI